MQKSVVLSLSKSKVAQYVQDIHRLLLELNYIWKEATLPVYQWHCKKCEQTVDIVRSIAEYQDLPGDSEVPKPCTEGEQHEFSKVIGSTNFQLAGRGWYRDGYSK